MANQSNGWNTPPELLKAIRDFFGGEIDLDPCSNDNSKVGSAYWYKLPDSDGLELLWSVKLSGITKVFFNPPYGPYYLSADKKTQLSPKQYKDAGKPDGFKRFTMRDWIRKAIDGNSTCAGCSCDVESIGLVPARGVGNATWQKWIWPYTDAICFLNKRYPFWENGKPAKNSGTFDLALLYYGANVNKFEQHFKKYGYVKA